MTVRISPQKASRILHFFFEGMPQAEIARKFGINQATVSRYVLRLKGEADSQGLMTAAKEYGVMHEIDSLRSLAIELSRNKLTAEESKEGVDILKAFGDLGVPPADHESLIKVVSKLKSADFVPAALKLAELEASTGKSYGEIVSKFEQLSSQIAELDGRCAALGKERDSLKQAVKQLATAKKNEEQELCRLEEEARQKKLSLDREVAQKMKEVGLTLKRIETLMPLTMLLKKLDIADDSLEIYLKERQELEKAGIAWDDFKTIVKSMEDETSKIDAEKLAERLVAYGSLDRAIEEVGSQLISSKAQMEEIEGKRKHLQDEVAGLLKRRTGLKEEIGQLGKQEKALSQTIVTLGGKEKELKDYLPGLEDLVKILEARKLDLEKRVPELEEETREREERLKALAGTSEELEEKATLLKELEAKRAAAGLRFELFEGLLGFVRANTADELGPFLRTLPKLIDAAKQGEHDADFLKEYVLQTLTGDTLKAAACTECGVEFVVVGHTGSRKPDSLSTHRTMPTYCPICGQTSRVFPRVHIAEALIEKLKPVELTGIVIEKWGPEAKPPEGGIGPFRAVRRVPPEAKPSAAEQKKDDGEAGK